MDGQTKGFSEFLTQCEMADKSKKDSIGSHFTSWKGCSNKNLKLYYAINTNKQHHITCDYSHIYYNAQIWNTNK